MKYSKKIVGILLAVVLSATSIMGCSSASVEDTDVLMTINDEEVSFGVVNFYATFFAAYYESYYSSYFGDTMWQTEVDDYGTTYEEETKESVLTTVQEIVVVRQHAEEYGVELTEDELAAITEAAETFYNANSEEIRNMVSGSIENAIEILSLFEIDQKVYEVVIQDVDTDVSDEEAAQKRASYVYCYLTTTDDDGNSVDMTEDEIATLVEELEALIAESEGGDLYTIAEEAGYNVLSTSFDDETTSLNTDLVAALVELEEGELTDVIMSDSIYYVGQLTSEFDEEATESMKETIISEREGELYTELVAEWMEASEIDVDSDMWDIVDFEEYQYLMYYETTTTEETVE